MSDVYDYELLLATEKAIAHRHGIAWKRVDRDWVRREALKQLKQGRQ